MKNLLVSNKSFLPDLSYFILRFSTGLMMCYYHGWSKILGDTDRWSRLGNGLTQWFGLDVLNVPLGFMAAFSESIGALLLAVGFMTRSTSFLLAFTMLVATIKNITGVGIEKAELSLLFLILSCVIFMRGSGKYSLDELFLKLK
ncbi:DoxX family protein [Flavobacteriaceae bacterium]|jgi:putative oxidoreductase|nr:DoxX family protein [Flavobacteriaceae bacterium]